MSAIYSEDPRLPVENIEKVCRGSVPNNYFGGASTPCGGVTLASSHKAYLVSLTMMLTTLTDFHDLEFNGIESR